MADTIWQLRVREKLKLCSIWRLKIQIKCYVFIEIRVQGFSRSMITIVQSDFRNSRWLSQFGNDKFEKRLNYDQIWYTGVFEVPDHDLAIIHSKL